MRPKKIVWEDILKPIIPRKKRGDSSQEEKKYAVVRIPEYQKDKLDELKLAFEAMLSEEGCLPGESSEEEEQGKKIHLTQEQFFNVLYEGALRLAPKITGYLKATSTGSSKQGESSPLPQETTEIITTVGNEDHVEKETPQQGNLLKEDDFLRVMSDMFPIVPKSEPKHQYKFVGKEGDEYKAFDFKWGIMASKKESDSEFSSDETPAQDMFDHGFVLVRDDGAQFTSLEIESDGIMMTAYSLCLFDDK